MRVKAGGVEVIAETAEEWVHIDASGCDEVEAIFPDHEGTAIWVRPDLARGVLMRSMSEQHGWRVLSEVDDNYLTNPNLSLFLREQGWSEDTRRSHLKALCAAHGVIFSTTDLRDSYWKGMRKRWGKLNLELHVCRNHIASTDWPEIVPRVGPLRVGWMGSPSHVWDVDIAWPAMLYAKQRGASTYFIGYHPAIDPLQMTENTGTKLSERAMHKVRQWRKVEAFHVPWRQPSKYERFALPLDIGLCPLRTDEMTLGKSDVKALEYGISGAAVVAQNNTVYNKTLIHGETALLAGSPQEMLKHTALLMKDENLRERLVANLQQYIREERSEFQMRQEWMAAISG
jgi:glycosyltransferase involved in cell wall biosynthesis